jgi:hypothetical protein
MAKQFGLLEKKESYSQLVSRYSRSKEFGEQIHTQNLQDQKNKEIKSGSNPSSDDTQENPYSFLSK